MFTSITKNLRLNLYKYIYCILKYAVIVWDKIVAIKRKYIAEEFLNLNWQIIPKYLQIFPVTYICA